MRGTNVFGVVMRLACNNSENHLRLYNRRCYPDLEVDNTRITNREYPPLYSHSRQGNRALPVSDSHKGVTEARKGLFYFFTTG